MPEPFSLPVSGVVAALRTDAERGLTAAEARVRLALHGANVLRLPRRPAYARIAGRQLASPLVALLVAAATVSAAIGDGLEAAVIGAIVVLNGVLGFAREASGERALIALQRSVERMASVVRDGEEIEIKAAGVVPGDLLVLREGDRVAADARVVAAPGLEVEEAALTGESAPVEKRTEPVPADTPLGDRSPMVWAGTAVVRGRGLAAVVATGNDTEMGGIAALAGETSPPQTPLQQRLGRLARLMVGVGAAVTVLIATAGLLRGDSAHEAFLLAVAVAVAVVPEGLLAIVTVALALGAQELARRGAIVRRLSAIETLGETTVICADKTGTLTQNTLHLAATLPAPGVDVEALLAGAVLASTAELLAGEHAPRIAGDPVDGAILLGAREHGIGRARLLEQRRAVLEVPFDAERRRMTVVYDEAPGLSLFVKGAPEDVLARSADAAVARALGGEAHAWAARGLRVLAVATRNLPHGYGLDSADDLERDLVPLGLVGLEDPLRAGAKASLAEARAAGLEVRMLTGDHAATALAAARELGLPAEAVHARMTPAEKLHLVAELQARGEIVAVTGDGINDAPALRRADVGVAMGRSGTEAAREAASLVLTDDDFATIVSAIREGRRVAANVTKSVAFLLSANLGEVVLFGAAVAAGLGAPMTVIQVLLVNVVTDGLPALALARDPADPGMMAAGPRRGLRSLTRGPVAALSLAGVLVGVCALGALLAGRALGSDSAQTMAFATVAVGELAFVFGCRSLSTPAWRAPRNAYLTAGAALSAAIVALAVWVPGLHQALGTVSLGWRETAIVLGLAIVPLAMVETVKAALRRTSSYLPNRAPSCRAPRARRPRAPARPRGSTGQRRGR